MQCVITCNHYCSSADAWISQSISKESALIANQSCSYQVLRSPRLLRRTSSLYAMTSRHLDQQVRNKLYMLYFARLLQVACWYEKQRPFLSPAHFLSSNVCDTHAHAPCVFCSTCICWPYSLTEPTDMFQIHTLLRSWNISASTNSATTLH